MEKKFLLFFAAAVLIAGCAQPANNAPAATPTLLPSATLAPTASAFAQPAVNLTPNPPAPTVLGAAAASTPCKSIVDETDLTSVFGEKTWFVETKTSEESCLLYLDFYGKKTYFGNVNAHDKAYLLVTDGSCQKTNKMENASCAKTSALGDPTYETVVRQAGYSQYSYQFLIKSGAVAAAVYLTDQNLPKGKDFGAAISNENALALAKRIQERQ